MSNEESEYRKYCKTKRKVMSQVGNLRMSLGIKLDFRINLRMNLCPQNKLRMKLRYCNKPQNETTTLERTLEWNYDLGINHRIKWSSENVEIMFRRRCGTGGNLTFNVANRTLKILLKLVEIDVPGGNLRINLRMKLDCILNLTLKS